MSVRNAVTRIPNHEHSVSFARIFWSCAGFGLAVGFLELLRLWFQILHDYGDATVGCIERLSGRALHLIGIPRTSETSSPRNPSCCINRRAALARSVESSQFPHSRRPA